MIRGILFSKDRALQLDATLRSFYRHCEDAEKVMMTVLYKASSKGYTRQYAELVKSYSDLPFLSFQREDTFRQDVLRLLNPYLNRRLLSAWYRKITTLDPRFAQWLFHFLPRSKKGTFILFLVDDNIFVRNFSIQEVIKQLQEHRDGLGFSLRLGENTTYCYTVDKKQELPEFTDLGTEYLKFNWVDAEGDFGYPFEVSSSVYRLGYILPVLIGQSFHNPNLLEGRMANQREVFSKRFPSLLCLKKSVTFCNPINVVQSITENRAGAQFQYTPQELAGLFDEGYRIKVEEYDGFVPNACHQEVPLHVKASEIYYQVAG